jgi:hypothetical protein
VAFKHELVHERNVGHKSDTLGVQVSRVSDNVKVTLPSLWGEGDVAVTVFARSFGCPFCQYAPPLQGNSREISHTKCYWPSRSPSTRTSHCVANKYTVALQTISTDETPRFTFLGLQKHEYYQLRHRRQDAKLQPIANLRTNCTCTMPRPHTTHNKSAYYRPHFQLRGSANIICDGWGRS